jgi:hypothetical protein
MRPLLTGLAVLFISGCNADLQQMARASCALTTECYAPGVAPGTNPYNSWSKKSASADTRMQNTLDLAKSINARKAPLVTFPIAWHQNCSARYGQLYLIGHVKVKGKKVCQYG